MNKRIDFRHEKDLLCCLLGHAGFHTRAIQHQTGLSPGQVGYCLKMAEIKRADYRNGESDMAHLVLAQVRGRETVRDTTTAARSIQDHLLAEEVRLEKLTIQRLKANGRRSKTKAKT